MAEQAPVKRKKVTIPTLMDKKKRKEPIARAPIDRKIVRARSS